MTVMLARAFSNDSGILAAIGRANEFLIPAEDVLPSKYAEENIVIPVGNAVPGPIRFDAATYQRGMIDVIKEPGIERVSYMLGAQLGKTTIQQCITAYFIDHDPRSMIWLTPSEGDMATFRSTKLQPMLDANSRIRNKMAKPRGREGQNNGRMISFIGGWLMFSWAGSAKTLRGRSAPVTLADEIDGMAAQAGSKEAGEGDPVELLRQRAASFSSSGQAIHIEASTPTTLLESRINRAFVAGDQRHFWVRCPHCELLQVMDWERVEWIGKQGDPDKDKAFEDHQAETAVYVCAGCGVGWNDADRISAVRDAEKQGGGWRASKPFTGHASFHLPEWYSPFRRLRDIVRSYLDKVKADSYNTFVNVSMGLPFEDVIDAVDPNRLKDRAETYQAQVPIGGLYLCAGVDMQQDRLEVEVVGWGAGEESWSVDYRVLWGDPLAGDVWNDLDDFLSGKYMHESGMELGISAACLDTGGNKGYTQSAYDYLRTRRGHRIFGIKGIGGWGRPVVEKVMRKQSGKDARKVDLFRVGVDEAKQVVMKRLQLTSPGPGYMHFPDRDGLDEWLQQLTAEKLKVRYVKGEAVKEWVKADKARNEGLDCRVYAYAALKIMQPSFKRLQARLEAFIASKKDAPEQVPSQPEREKTLMATEPVKEKTAKSKPTRRKKSGWANGWR